MPYTVLRRREHIRSVEMLDTRQLAAGRNDMQIFHIAVVIFNVP